MDKYFNAIQTRLDELIQISIKERQEHGMGALFLDFTKINNTLGFKTKWNLEKGIKQLYDFFKKEKLIENDFHDKKFYRLKQLKWLIANGFLDENLRLN